MMSEGQAGQPGGTMVKEWIVRATDGSRHVDGGLALALIQQVGRARFADVLLQQVNRHAAFEHCTIYELTLDAADRLACRVLDAASRHQVPTAHKTSILFAQKYSRLDVNRRYLGHPNAPARQVATYFLARDLPHHEYRETCYTRNGLVDRFSLLSMERPDCAVALNFYKSSRQGKTESSEREQLLWNAPLLLEAAMRHASMLRPAPSRSGADLLARIASPEPLTPRESQLCSLLLEGLTVQQAADRMGIRPTTAVTLKKRGFARLGLRSKEELLRRCAA